MYFDNFDDIFSKIWNNFSRPVLDQKPFRAIEVDKGYLIVVNTLGIDKKDLTVTLENEKGRPFPILKVIGATKNEKINFENNVNLGIMLKIDNKIKGLSYKSENGLTTVFVEVEKESEEKNTINAKLIDGDDTSLDW